MFIDVKQDFPIIFVTKTRYPKNLYLALFVNLSVLSAMSPIIVKVSKHFGIRSGEHVGVPPLPGKKVKSSNNSAICDHLHDCKFLPSFDKFSF